MSSLTKRTLPTLDSVLGQAGMLDALLQLSGLQSLQCQDNVMQMLSVPRSWSLLTKLQHDASITDSVMDQHDALFWSLEERQCPQLQALAVHKATSLRLTALTCNYWLPSRHRQLTVLSSGRPPCGVQSQSQPAA